MSDTLGKGILKGKPFGGLAILINKRFAKGVKCLFREDRFIIVLLHDVLLVNLHLPVLGSVSNYGDVVINVITAICTARDMYSNYQMIIGGDFNFLF
jgi:hypothetical protein